MSVYLQATLVFYMVYSIYISAAVTTTGLLLELLGVKFRSINPLMGTLKQQSNGP